MIKKISLSDYWSCHKHMYACIHTLVKNPPTYLSSCSNAIRITNMVIFVTGPAKTGHICTGYTCLDIDMLPGFCS